MSVDGDESLKRQAKGVLREDSDRLLRAVHELRDLEKRKRTMEISSDSFHDLARQVESKAREVFRLAEEQQHDGEVVDRLEDAEPGPGNAGTIAGVRGASREDESGAGGG